AEERAACPVRCVEIDRVVAVVDEDRDGALERVAEFPEPGVEAEVDLASLAGLENDLLVREALGELGRRRGGSSLDEPAAGPLDGDLVQAAAIGALDDVHRKRVEEFVREDDAVYLPRPVREVFGAEADERRLERVAASVVDLDGFVAQAGAQARLAAREPVED